MNGGVDECDGAHQRHGWEGGRGVSMALKPGAWQAGATPTQKGTPHLTSPFVSPIHSSHIYPTCSPCLLLFRKARLGYVLRNTLKEHRRRTISENYRNTLDISPAAKNRIRLIISFPRRIGGW